ncbi:hypothetical protein [Aeromonas phage 4L372XY]|uniref:Uncharacterized protein n=2 Tax=Plateaulakevirus TaxID=2843436 RepID=A0A5B9N8J5_9CAUD|nr:hypothetical protein HWC25_gp152 [Aeromonas phage 2L372D]YP_009846946.1 hypothetical protein HWC28_gp147 [Aeromonas phage 4L372XY]QDB74066.1 hypothetical protein 2L372D_152 [Aeromonas phage 2L372D]QEG08862.1 hypothetical protein [Aeromonas phage 4L372XY]
MKKSIKGLTILIIVSSIMIAGTFAPSVNSSESKAYSRYKLVSESISGTYKTCLYRNVRGETKSTSINKGKRCPSTY